MSINPLSNPKGVKLLCELCQKPAFIQCPQCRVTYYCCVEHQRADWMGVHEKICDLLVPLRTSTGFLTSQEQRSSRKAWLLEKKMEMIELTQTTGQKLLFEGKHGQAVPAALQSLKFAIEVYGLSSIHLVPPYLILGEASIGLGRLGQAEVYLMQANWTVVKTPGCSDSIKSKLYRNLGLLFAAKGEYDEALRNLADDIYHSSMAIGTDDVQTSGGYYHMANIFFRQNQMDVADSLYSRVVAIWHEKLMKIIRVRTKTPLMARGPGPVFEDEEEEEEKLDEAQQAEALQVLNAILDIREHTQPAKVDEVVRINHALAMIFFAFKDLDKSRMYCRKATVLIQEAPGLSTKVGSAAATTQELYESVKDFSNVCDQWVFTPAITVRKSTKVESTM